THLAEILRGQLVVAAPGYDVTGPVDHRRRESSREAGLGEQAPGLHRIVADEILRPCRLDLGGVELPVLEGAGDEAGIDAALAEQQRVVAGLAVDGQRHRRRTRTSLKGG